jgi:hypothetical protein
MKITIKEAYEQVKKSLPGYKVEVEVSLGSTWSNEEKGISWKLSAQKENSKQSSIYEADEMFGVALAKLVAEATRKNRKKVEDVEVDDSETVAKTEEPEKEDDSLVKPEDLPF